jgi:hypothetical protein
MASIHGSAETNENTAIDKLLEMVFLMWSMLRLYSKNEEAS